MVKGWKLSGLETSKGAWWATKGTPPMMFLSEREKTILEFIWTIKKIPSGSRNLGTEEQSGVITLPDFKLYYKAWAIQAVWYGRKNGHVGQWKWMESPKISPHIDGQLVLKAERAVSSITRAGRLDSPKQRDRPHLTPFTTINSKQVRDLNVRPRAMKRTESNREKASWDASRWSFSGYDTEKHRQQKQK